MKDANASITLLEKWPEKISSSERDSNLRPFRYRCNALPTELSKPHESGRVWVRPYMLSGRNTRLKHMNSMVIDVQQKFFQVIFPVVLWLHSHLSFFHLIATVELIEFVMSLRKIYKNYIKVSWKRKQRIQRISIHVSRSPVISTNK